MFLVNSRLGLVTAAPSGSTREALHPTGAPLLPKLRGQFAEFLDDGSLVHLGMLYQPTCVGLRYGRASTSLEPFLDSPASIRPAWRNAPHLPLTSRSSPQGICLPGLPTSLEGIAAPGPSSLYRPSLKRSGTGQESEPAVHRLRVPASA